MELAQESDEGLMRRVAEGDRDSLTILLRRYASPLLTFIRRMSCDYHRSEELFQDVFLALWKGRSKYRYPESFRPWLFGIAANICRADRRSRKPSPYPLEEGSSLQPVCRDSSPVEGAIVVETVAMIERAIMCLPVQQRTVVVLRLWNEFTYAEIAEILQRDESTIRSNMFHGLASLRRILEPRMRSC